MPVDTGIEVREFRLRAAEVTEEGTFSGYASTFGNADSYGDVIERGAFSKTLRDQPVRPLLWCHEPREVIGVAELAEDARGLRLQGRLELAVGRAREVHALMRAGAVRGLSIGFIPRQSEARGEGRVLREVELIEVSLTPFPANPRAQVENVRAHQPAPAAAKREELSEMEIKQIEAKFDEFGTKLAELGEKFAETRKQVDLIDGRLQGGMPSFGGGAVKTLGEQVAASLLEHKSAFDRHGRVAFSVKAITSAGLVAPAPAGVIGSDATGLGAYGQVRRRLRTLPAPSGAIYLIRESDGSGWQASPAIETNVKHESTVTLTSTTIPCETIATWIAATKQSLEDVDGLQAFINSRLVQAIERELEEQLLLGSGTPPNLHGLVTNATTWTVPTGWTSWNLYDVLLLAATQCRLNGFEPSIAVLHPSDVARLRLQKDTQGNYLRAPDGVPEIIASPAMAQGQALLGDASQAVLRMREDIGIEISTEHSDYFTRNMVAIRAEMRAALQITSPKAWLKFALASSPA